MVTPGTLFVVATPLGNLGDLSPRAAETLRTVDTVAAEDTRRTKGLLSSIDAHPRLVSYHAHSDDRRSESLIAILTEGRNVALVTDAGTPAISDPGHLLVAAARRAGVPVVPVAGPSAVAAALSASGLAGDRYLFLGFIPRKGRERKELLARAAIEPWSVVFFEAPGRLAALLADLKDGAGSERIVVVARELTKLHEEFRRGTTAELAAWYLDEPVRGEVTVILAGCPPGHGSPPPPDPAEVIALIRAHLAAGESRKDTVRMVTARYGLSRNDAYRLVTDEP
ncbi:MAG: 16S rRNA (cytidine(1402)-2'-O)-methyltransferase [Gemmatimonadales bacterium]|nr:16S rRNA (cytidine(1402)-2'-O)-methyltransferase [Gemmatimonadales bacterium]